MRRVDNGGETYGSDSRQSQLNRQGIIHLDVKEQKEVEFLLRMMMEEQENHQGGMADIKMACLQTILIKFGRNR